jgi:predicted MPP superfamily phosphohydrolase
MRLFILGFVFLGIMGLMNVYIYRRFLGKLGPRLSRVLIIVPLALMLGEILFVIEAFTHYLIESSLLYIVLSASVGVTFLLFVVALIYDLAITVSSKVPLDRERRRFIKVLFDITMLIAAVSYLLRGLADGLKRPGLNTVHVQISDFPFSNYSIVQLTDIHVGQTIQRDFVQDLVDRTNQLEPDLVVITGDLVDLPISHIRRHLEPLRGLKAPVYFVLGNHEYFHGVKEIIAYVRELGIHPLLNDSVLIGDEQRGFDLLGINDLSSRRMGIEPYDIERTYAKTDPGRPCIFLAHQPKTIELIEDRRCDLMLSGHTHGGQIFPFGLLVMIDQPYVAGLFQHDQERQIFVSRGTGYWGPPLRILAPSEISHIIINSEVSA